MTSFNLTNLIPCLGSLTFDFFWIFRVACRLLMSQKHHSGRSNKVHDGWQVASVTFDLFVMLAVGVYLGLLFLILLVTTKVLATWHSCWFLLLHWKWACFCSSKKIMPRWNCRTDLFWIAGQLTSKHFNHVGCRDLMIWLEHYADHLHARLNLLNFMLDSSLMQTFWPLVGVIMPCVSSTL